MNARLAKLGLVEPRASIENPNTPLTGKELLKAFGSIETSSGVVISPEAALSHPDVYACVRVISEYIAMLPIQVFKRQRDDSGDLLGKKPAPNHPLWPLLHELPNPEMTAVEVVEAMVGHVLLRGNAYAHVVRNGGGEVLEIWPLRPDRVWVYRKLGETGEMLPGGDLQYIYTPYAGQPIKFNEDEIWHVKGLSTDGLLGYSPIQLQAEAMGGAIAAEKYAGRFFANDARPGGVFMHPGQLSDKAYNRLLQAINDAHRGFDNAHKMMLLEEGISWQQVGLAPDAAQFLQTRQFNTEQISRMFRVPGRLINDERHPSRLSAEDATAEDVRQLVMPWTRRFELSIKRDILNLKRDRDYFAKFNLSLLLKASLAARTAYYSAGRQNGWLSANDVRVEEDMNPIGPEGDHYMVPVNMEPAENLDKEPDADDQGAAPKGPPTTAKGPASNDPSKGSDNNAARTPTELREAFEGLLSDATERVLRRERRDVLELARKAFKRGEPQLLSEWLPDFYANHGPFVGDALSASLNAYVRATAQDGSRAAYAATEAVRTHIDATDRAIRAVLAGEDATLEAIEALYADSALAGRAKSAGKALIEALSTE